MKKLIIVLLAVVTLTCAAFAITTAALPAPASSAITPAPIPAQHAERVCFPSLDGSAPFCIQTHLECSEMPNGGIICQQVPNA